MRTIARATGSRYTAYDLHSESPSRPGSRVELHRRARTEARVRHGRSAFVWNARVLPMGIPLGLLAGYLAWRRSRSEAAAVGTFAGVVLGSYGLGVLEFERYRRTYRAMHEGARR